MSYRSVRFQQLLPFQLQPQTSRDDDNPGPLFSPTLVTGTQKVLHSIFSHTATSTGTTFSSRDGFQLQPQTSRDDDNPGSLFSPTLVPGTQKVLHSIFLPTATSTGTTFSSRALKTPGKPKGLNAARKTSPRSRAIHFNDNSSPRTQGEPFYSPSQTAISSPPVQAAIGSPFTPFSGISRITNATAATRTSFQALSKIQMLSLDYIKSTSSIKELRQIVNFLKEQENKYPSLLRAAQKRFTDVQQKQPVPCDFRRCEFVPPPLMRPAPPDSSHEPENESTLIMSLSSDDDSDLVLMSTAARKAIALKAPIPPPRISPGRVLPVGSQPNATHREEELCNEIQCLTSKLWELESGRLADQKELWHNLEKMETGKQRAENNMEALHGQVAKSNKDTLARLEAMGELKEENKRLQKQLDRERKTGDDKNREALELEQQLKDKVEELTRKLSQIEKPSNHVASVERKNKELHQLLCSAQNNLDDIKNERDAMLQDLSNATGREPSRINKLSKRDRSQLVLDIAKEAASSKAALNAMAKTLAGSENNCYESMQLQQRVEAHLEATVQSSRRLEWDNLQLTRELQHVCDELTASRKYADELMTSARAKQQKSWEKQEAVYKKVIRGLKEQLRTDETVVSMALYKSAVEEGRTKVRECESHQENVSRMNSKVAQLEWQLKGWQTRSDKENSSTLLLPSSERVTSKKASKEETTVAKAPFKTTEIKRRNVAFTCIPPPADKNDGRKRITMVRAAGGRKGLQKKLNQVRSPRAGPAPLHANNA